MSDLCPTCGGGVFPGRQITQCPDAFHKATVGDQSRQAMREQYRKMYDDAKSEIDGLVTTGPVQGFLVPFNLLEDFTNGYMSWGELLGRLRMYAAVAKNESELPANSLILGV